MQTTSCPIWGTSAQVRSTTRDECDVVSLRAGGRYAITREAKVNLRSADERERALLTTWIVDQHRAGEECPTITTKVLEAARLRASLKLSVKFERLFEFLSKQLRFVGEEIAIAPKWLIAVGESTIYHEGQKPDDVESIRHKLCAWLECIKDDELTAIVKLQIDLGLFKNDDTKIILTAKGYERLEEVERRLVPSVQAFVAMWFSDEMNDAYQHGIEPAIREAGYEPLRIDRKEHVNKIDDEIIAEIRRSRFLVADFTCGIVHDGDRAVGVPRGGVYYEAGFAQGLGIPVIWCCRADCIEHVHFDTRQFAHIVWTDAADLRTRLRNRIVAVLGEAPSP